MAAVLAGGEGAVLSHVAAATHWELLQTSVAKVDVTVPYPRRCRSTGRLRVHRARLHHRDALLHRRIPVTSPARTLLDLAEAVSPSRLRMAYEAAERRGLFDGHQMSAVLARSHGRRGLAPLRRLLEEALEEPPELRSGDERLLYELIRSAGLPLPQTNVVAHGVTVDAHWPAHRLVVELDSFGYHRSRSAFERDRANTNLPLDAGLRVRRFSREQLHADPAALVASLGSELA